MTDIPMPTRIAADGAVALRALDAQLATALTLLPPRTDTTTECPA